MSRLAIELVLSLFVDYSILLAIPYWLIELFALRAFDPFGHLARMFGDQNLAIERWLTLNWQVNCWPTMFKVSTMFTFVKSQFAIDQSNLVRT